MVSDTHSNICMPEPAHDLKLHRPNILVADMDRALNLYRDILGFKVDFLMDSMGVAFDIFQLPESARRSTSWRPALSSLSALPSNRATLTAPRCPPDCRNSTDLLRGLLRR